MRILIGGMNHESNGLSPIVTGPEDFSVSCGNEVTENPQPNSSLRGIVTTLRTAGCVLVPTLCARAIPNGLVSADFYNSLKTEILLRTQEALRGGPVDGVCFSLHGSMKAVGLGPAEGGLMAELRRLVGDVPIVAAFDMHGTVTPELLGAVDGFAGYKTAPHVDCEETGAQAARILLRALESGKRPYTACERIPMLVAGEKSDSSAEPMAGLLDGCRELERSGRALSATYLLGFPWADDEHNAVSALVTVEAAGRAAEAAAMAREMARAFWDKRAEFRFSVEHYGSAEAVEAACRAVLERGERPVFLSDSGDNPTAGATGDATELFEKILAARALVEKLPTPLVYAGFFDEKAAAACVAAGEGARIAITVGGTYDKVNGRPIPLDVEVVRLARGYGTRRADLALAACGNIRLVLASKHIGFCEGDLLPALGVDAAAHCLVVVKLGYLEPCFRSIARRSILAVSKGCSNEALETIPYRRIRRPMYPLDQM